MVEYIEAKHLLPSRMSSFRKCHSIVTALISITDDIIKAMKRGEVTLNSFLSDFSKAYDTVHFADIIIRTLHSIGFSHHFFRWILSYLVDRQQCVQIDDKRSEKLTSQFGAL